MKAEEAKRDRAALILLGPKREQRAVPPPAPLRMQTLILPRSVLQDERKLIV